jgi:hypothetical protein
MNKRRMIVIIELKANDIALSGGNSTQNPYIKQIAICMSTNRIPKTLVALPGDVLTLSYFLISDALE